MIDYATLASIKNKGRAELVRQMHELEQRHRPREIMQYEDGGKMVRVFEARWCV